MVGKIIGFGNLKGGVGKSCLCAMFASYCVKHHLGVGVLDACPVQSLIQLRKLEIKCGNNEEEAWTLGSLFSYYHDIPGLKDALCRGTNDLKENYNNTFLLIDCPRYPSEYQDTILKSLDVVIVPFDYTFADVDSTKKFIKHLKEVSSAEIIFVPNRIHHRYDDEKDKKIFAEARDLFEKYGLLSPEIKESACIDRFSTTEFLNKEQNKIVEPAFSYILEQIENEKRTTFILNKNVLQKLKYIAFIENTSMNDIVGQCLDKKINDWTKTNGSIKF